MEEFLRVGVVSNTHGVRGEVKVYPTTDDVKRFLHLKNVLLDTGTSLLELKVLSVRFHKNMVLMKFKGYEDINAVERYKGMDLLVSREDAVPLGEDEYFICDVMGAKVVTEEGETLGSVKDVITTGSNDVYVVKRKTGKDLLLPVIKECVLNVNVVEKTVTVRMMPGLDGLVE